MDRKTFAEKKTDKELEALEKKIAAQYLDAYRGLESEASEYFTKFEERYQQEYKAYLDGKYTKSEFYAWVNAQIARGKHWQDLRDNVAERMYAENEVAAAYINDATPSIWSLNYNFTAYEAEQHLGYTFELYDEQTVRRLIEEDPSLLPAITKKAIKRNKDLNWNRSQFTKDVTSAILMGQHPAKLAKTCLKHTVGLNQVSAIRNARTAITSAQNGGRMDGYKRLAEMGVQMQKEWIATLDERTRNSHRDMDGERVPYDKTFSNGLMFPGDPSGPGREVWNCRCTMRSIFPENSELRKVSYYGENAEAAYTDLEDEGGFADFVKRRIGQPMSADIAENKRLASKKADMSKYKLIEEMGSLMDELEKVNPNYPHYGYNKNCQRCVVAFEARLRGYDVTALPKPKYDVLGQRNTKYGYTAVFDGGKFESCVVVHGADVYSNILAKMTNYGEGSRAIVRIPRKEAPGHVIMAIYEKNEISLLDPQTGKYVRESLLKESDSNDIMIMRIDDKEFTGLIKKCVR